MSTPPPPAPWLAARLHAYAARLGLRGAQAEDAVQGALRAADPYQAIVHLQRTQIGATTPEPDAQWVRARVLDHLGIPADAGHALLTQLAPLSRTCMAAQPFRRPTLRRALSALIYQPLSRVLRRIQFLAPRESP